MFVIEGASEFFRVSKCGLKALALFCAVILPFCIISTSYAQDSESNELRIIYMSNMPNIVGDNNMPSFAKFATFIKAERAAHPNLLFIHGGDSLAPSVLSSLDRGAHVIDLLNNLNPDLMAISKREFSFGEDILIMRSQEALFPFISNNIRNIDTQLPYSSFEEGVIINVNGLKIGVMASVSDVVLERYSPKKTIFDDVVESAIITSANLRAAGAQMIVLMYDNKDQRLANLIDDGVIDILFETSYVEDGIFPPSDPRYIHHDIASGFVSTVDIAYHPDAVQKIEIVNLQHVELSDIEDNPETKILIDNYITPLSFMLDMKLGITNTSFSTKRSDVRTKENAFANFIVDSMRIKSKTDIAMINGGAIRGNKIYEVGDEISRRDIQSELPFRNTISKIEITGAELLSAIEHGLDCMAITAGCGVHLSHMKVRFDPALPSGQRIVSATVDGMPVDLEKTYSLATTTYIARGGDGFTMFDGKFDITNQFNNVFIWEIVSNIIFQHNSITPELEGRLEPINNSN